MAKKPTIAALDDLPAAQPGGAEPLPPIHEQAAARAESPTVGPTRSASKASGTKEVPARPTAAEVADEPTKLDIKARAVPMTIYLLPEDHRRLKILAVNLGCSIQTLAMDGFDSVFERHGEVSVERWEPRQKKRR